VVGDNLNTPTLGACYDACAPEKARALVRRIAFRDPPKHGSWLNVAANELRRLTQPWFQDRRLGDLAPLQTEASAGETHSNTKPRGVNGQFQSNEARTKLPSLYSKIVN
jgi:hypothetical protein